MKLRVALLVAGSLTIPFVHAEPVQSPNIVLPGTAANDRAAVIQLFQSSYNVYEHFAPGHDEVTPMSEGFTDPRNGWGASVVDALGTMAIMGLDDEVKAAVDFVSKIDFSKSKTANQVSVFETTIRYLGGLLSAYELTNRKYDVLLQKARQLGDKLVYAWDGDNDIPYGYLDFTSNTPARGTSNIAEAGTLSLEFETLSRYTQNQTYGNFALRAATRIAQNPAPLPGLAAQGIDPGTGQPVGGYVTWGGGSDSCFEYYLKYTRLFDPTDTILIDTWSTAVDTSIKTLLKTSTVGDRVYLADYDDEKKIRHVGSHLACFYGGNWILGGKILNNQTIVDYGLQLTDSCWNTYESTESGIGPEVFSFISDDGNYTGNGLPTSAQLDFYEKHGFYITYPVYILRPEVLESNFYAWRATGDPKYYERARTAVDKFNSHVIFPRNGGAVGLNDVNNLSSGQIDDTPSFWFAEVLKYLYLTFDDPNKISLDTHVFNTECHPLQAPTAKNSYGSGNLVKNKQKFSPTSGNGQAPPISSNHALPTPLQQVLHIR